MQFTVKLFPEITIKSRPVRQRMVRQLRNNLQKLLKPVDKNICVSQQWDRIQVHCPEGIESSHQQLVKILTCTPGISNVVEVAEYPWLGMDDAFEKIRVIYEEQLKDHTFALRCKRSGQHSFKSTDVEYEVGGRLKKHCGTAGVNLDNPDVMIKIEINQDTFSVVLQRYQGLGGYPLGTQEDVLSLVSGGFDSTVASYFTIKRGLTTHFCFFNLGGQAHEIGVKEVAVYLWMKYGASHPVKFITVPFEGVVKEILEQVENSQMGVVLKRMMLRVATQVADKLKIKALVTGESVAQVSSQTLTNLAIIDSVTDTLVLRPLITMDKVDIIEVSRKIGTEAFAEAMPEYCGVISVKPTTRAKIDRIQSEEEKFDMAVLEQALSDARIVNINNIVSDIQHKTDVNIIEEPDDHYRIIDIRHPDEVEKKPLSCDIKNVVKIPFYNLHSQFESLDQSQQWLLYCEKGIMSQLHAQYLTDQGHTNVGVFRPPSHIPSPDTKLQAQAG